MPNFPLSTETFQKFENQILTVDLHVAGEPLRLVIGGLASIPGDTMNDKRIYVRENLDHVRGLLTCEPRGHRDMFAGIVTEASTADCQFGIIFMDARRYPYMCGHGIIGAVTTFIEMGWLPGKTDGTCVAVDTPSGIILTTAVVKKASNELVRVESVCVQMESAFAFLIDQALDVPGYGRFTVDVSFAGGFFVMVPVDQTGLTLTRKDAPKLAHMGMAIIEASNQQIEVQHPSRPYIRSIDVVEFYDPKGHKTLRGKNIVILGEGHVDRSPCGTGTSAKMALLYSRGELGVGKKFINEGLTGMTFEGTIDQEINVGGIPAIVPKICGTAYITGMHRFVLRPDDPFPRGFLI